MEIISLQAQMPDPKTYKQHFENKHPKNELPDDLKNIWGYKLLYSFRDSVRAQKKICCNWPSDTVQRSADPCIVPENELNLVSVLTRCSRTRQHVVHDSDGSADAMIYLWEILICKHFSPTSYNRYFSHKRYIWRDSVYIFK